MPDWFRSIHHSLVAKIIIATGVSLLLCTVATSYFSIRYQKSHAMDELTAGADRLSNTINLGTHYAMLKYARNEISHIIRNVSRQKEIVSIRIYNKEGLIKYSSHPEEVDQATNIRHEACIVCHRSDPPLTTLDLPERTRIFSTPHGERLLASLSPIYNEPSCSNDPCHVHPPEKVVLGALDVVLNLGDAEREILFYQQRIGMLAGAVFLLTSTGFFIFLSRFVKQPIRRLIDGTRLIGKGLFFGTLNVQQQDEIGELATAIDKMALEINEKQSELNRQRDEYQQLFAQVPCTITVQDRDFRLLRYNREFGERFKPRLGEYCYRAYKGRTEKCDNCPVERTFATGKPQTSEESGFNKDGSPAHWIVHTSPIFDTNGEIVAAMEMCLDITARKGLEDKLTRSEQKYHAIFSNIPNSVFVLDRKTLEIVDCNETVESVYGYSCRDLIGRSFLDFISPEERERYESHLKAFSVINQAKNVTKDGSVIYVDIHLSPAEFPSGRRVLLVTTTDITKRLETEQKLIQAGKMAILGEMATGVAHELNQPLTVIKAASGYFLKKLSKGERIDEQIMATMSREIDTYVNRATQIINHMREFGRKSDLSLETVRPGDILRKAFELFSRQLALRDIEVVWDLQEDLPMIMAEPNRLEQVFINLLLNARDAIEERSEKEPGAPKRISISTRREGGRVAVIIDDTGPGIAKSAMNRIFEPFFTTKKVGKGTGLGLSISYGLIKDFGGTIQARNKVDGGAVFTLKFPAAEVK